MSGGRLVVLDRLGRDVKRYPLTEGLATIGSDPACDIRVMLPIVSAHHATVVVHASQTVVRNVGDGDTLVNGRSVSVAALRHCDVITLGDRSLRWEYSDPTIRRVLTPEPALHVVRRAGRAARRGSAAAGGPPRDRALQLALEMTHRSSMPGSTGGKQVAIVQPQRRNTSEQNDNHPSRPNLHTNKRQRTIKNDLDTSVSETEGEKSKRKTNRISPKTMALQNTTKATLWIESRKTSPRKSGKVQTLSQVQANVRRTLSGKKSTPLRMAVLKKAQSAQRMRVMKIEAPLKIDHTKQAAIMLMTGHTPKSKLTSPKNKKTPSYLVKKQSPVRKTPRIKGRQGSWSSNENSSGIGVTPMRASTFSHGNTTRRSSKRSPGDQSVTLPEIKGAHAQNSTLRESNASRRSGRKTFQRSPLLPNTKKSALKDPKAKRNYRKTESIKFDLSNLENQTQESADVLMLTDTTKHTDSEESLSEDNLTLHYSDSSSLSPSPRKSIHSRGSKMLEKLGTSITLSPTSRTMTPDSPRARKSLRGSIIMQKALETSDRSDTTYANGTSKSVSDQNMDTTVASAFRTRTLSPRTSNRNMESYSIVDLLSIDSNESPKSVSVYNSVGSINSTAFGTPQNTTGRKTRSTINPTLLGSSTPYVGNATRSTRSLSSPNETKNTRSSVNTRRSKSLSTPENTQKHISVNSNRISRASRSRSRINDSDLLFLDDTEPEDSSPKSSKRVSRVAKSQSSPILQNSTKTTDNMNSPENEGTVTPENTCSPENIGTPVLSIQSLLNSSQNSLTFQNSGRKDRKLINYRRKTIGFISEPKKGRPDNKSKSFNVSARKAVLRLSKDSSEASDKTDEGAPKPDSEVVITPTSTVKLVLEDVKNKHSTAKKPLSKRSIIDDLNRSEIVKQLFNSPVKRKLSKSMTEFSRKRIFDDDEIILAKRPTRNTIALTGRTPDNSILDQTEAYTPERFISPINTPNSSPNLSGIKRLFKSNSPGNDLRNVKGIKTSMRTPRARRSVKNDLSNVSGVKAVFAKSPKNRLSDVRVKELFVAMPKNDLRRVSGVKSLFQSQTKNKSPKNDLSDVTGVRKLFKRKSPDNDLRNVSGVKQTLERVTPRNDLSDVRGVRRMFRQEKQKIDFNDVSGIEELFNESNQSHQNTEGLFDQLIGKPKIKAVYSKTFSTNLSRKRTPGNTKSLHTSLDMITNNVEEWLQKELQKCIHKNVATTSLNKSKNNVTREIKKIVTDTVEGGDPIQMSRTRNSTMMKSIQGDMKQSASERYSAHTLPIKKRSLGEASLEKSKNKLPIKKRVVVHSTPVKGRINFTMNASELGRVSPIATVDSTRAVDHNTSVRLQLRGIPEKKPRGRPPKSKIKPEPHPEPGVTEPSPRKTRAKAKTPPKTRTIRNRRDKMDNSNTIAKKRRPSLVISKKLPISSLEAVANVTRKEKAKTPKVSPKKTRATRSKKDDKIENTLTPKRTIRVKAAKGSVVVIKKSPQLKPQAVEAGLKIAKRVHLTEEDNTTKKRTRKTATENKVQSPKESHQVKSKRKTRANEPKTKGRRTEIEKPNAEEIEKPPPAKRGRKPHTAESNTQNQVKTGAKKMQTQDSVESEPIKRRRKAKRDDSTVLSELKARIKKAISDESSPKVQTRETRTHGRKRIIETTETETANVRQKRSVVMDSKMEIRSKQDGDTVNKSTKVVRRKVVEVTDTRKAGQSDVQPKLTRGRKAAITPDIPLESGKRKRKPTVETPPVKEVSKKQPAAKRARETADTSIVTPVNTRGRSTRAKNTRPEVSVKPAGRSRRR